MQSLSAKHAIQTESDPPVFRVVGLEMNELGRELTSPERSRLIASARTILLDESQAISTMADQLGDEFIHAVELILECKGNVIITGMGKAGHIARKISATMSSTGTPSCFLHPAEAFHGDLGMLGPNDLVMILSHSGETEEVCRLLPSLAEMKLSTIAITGKTGSRLGQFAQVTLALGQVSETGILGLAPSTSTTLMLALGDALALSVSEIRGFRAEDFARFHPGGSLGRKLSHVEEYMRPTNQCRVALQSKTIREIFVESHVPGRRSGAILLVDSSGRLTGIFTDSDLAKLFELREDKFIDCPVESVMTCHPKFIRSGSFMTEAVAMMGEKKISELPVLDDHDVPVGLLDITDLVSFLPENKSTSRS